MSRRWRNWYQNEVDEEIKGADSRDKVKHNEKGNQLFLERMICMCYLSHQITSFFRCNKKVICQKLEHGQVLHLNEKLLKIDISVFFH